MAINEVRFTKRYNCGNYEHEEYTVGAAVGDDENAMTVMTGIKEFVRGAHAYVPGHSDTVVESAPVPVAVEEKVVKTKKTKAAPAPVVVEEEQLELPQEAAPVVEEEVVEVKEEPKAKAVRKAKASPYTRGNDVHKKLLGEFLDTAYPGWRDNAAKAVEVSKLMVGKDFLDAEGTVVDSFKADFKAEMSK